MRTPLAALLAASTLLLAAPASAANILVVSDATAGSGIGAVLMGDGHTVTTVTGDFSTGNTALKAPLDAYEVVFWFANGSGGGSSHSDATLFTNLTSYVMGGGRVFVSGYDSIASPTDAMLIAFLGGTGARDVPSEPGAITMMENSLTIGVVDIRGVVPSGHAGDRDAMTGLMAGTVSVAATGTSATESQWTLRTLGGGEVAYVSNGNSSGTHGSWSTSTAGGAGAYNAAIRNFAAAGDTAAGDPGSPEITFDSGFALDEGGTLTIDVSIVDLEGDTYTHSWDLDDDEVFGETPGAMSYTIPAGTTDGPSSVRVGVQAMDAGGNTSSRYRTIRIVNVDPTITSEPPGVTSVGASLRYQIEVDEPAGAADPLTYALVDGPSRITINDTGLLSWVPNESDVTLGGETTRIEISVADGDDGIDSQIWEITVSPNHVPGSPALVFPIGGEVLADSAPRLVVQNAEDEDLDPLTYYFEIDTVETFDSPDLLASGPVDETPGISFWYPGELSQDTYFWRAWVSDGMVETEPAMTSFEVYLGLVETPDGAVDPDGGVGGDTSIAPPMMPPRDRSGCSATGTPSGAWWAALFGLALLGRRRRRR